MQIPDLCAPKFKVTIVEFIEPLTVFAHGVKLKLKHQDLEFTCNYNFPPFLYSGGEQNLAALIKKHEAIYYEEFPTGKELIVEAWLEDHSEDHNISAISETKPLGIKEIGELDWELIGKIESNIVNAQMLINCGFPVVTFAPHQIEQGALVKCTGELMLFPHET